MYGTQGGKPSCEGFPGKRIKKKKGAMEKYQINFSDVQLPD